MTQQAVCGRTGARHCRAMHDCFIRPRFIATKINLDLKIFKVVSSLTWPSKLLHVLAEVTVAAVGPQTRVALFAARSPSPRGVIRRLGRRRWATIVSGIGWRCRRIWRCKLLLLMLIVLLLLLLMLLLMVRRLLMRLLVMVSTVVLVMSTRRGRRRRVVLRRSGRNTGR